MKSMRYLLLMMFIKKFTDTFAKIIESKDKTCAFNRILLISHIIN